MAVMRGAGATARFDNTTLWLWDDESFRRAARGQFDLAPSASSRQGTSDYATLRPPAGRIPMNGNRYYGVRVEGAKYGVGFGSALAIAISYTNNHSILWAIIHGILSWLYVIYVALFG